MLSNRSQTGSFEEQFTRDCHNYRQRDLSPCEIRSVNILSTRPQPKNHLNMFADRSNSIRSPENRRTIREPRSSDTRAVREAQSSDNRQNFLSRYYPVKQSRVESNTPPAYESLYQNLESRSTTDSTIQMDTDSPEYGPTPPPTYQDYIQNLSETVIWYYLKISSSGHVLWINNGRTVQLSPFLYTCPLTN